MRRSLAGRIGLGLALGALAAAAPHEVEAQSRIDPRFVGNWELVSFVSFPESGGAVDNNYVARIMYDALGNMSAVGMPRDLPQRPRNADGSMQRSGFAYFSTVEMRAEDGFILHRVIGSPMAPNWVGTDLVRFFEFDEGGKILRLSLREGDRPSGRVTGTLTWRKME